MSRIWIRRAALFAAIMLAAWLSLSGLVARCLTRPLSIPSELAAAPVENHRLRTRDGEEIGAWLLRGTGPCVLLLHGNGSSRTAMRPVFDLWAGEDLCVCAISMRAHGDSTGDRNDFGYSAAADVVAAVEFLEREMPGRKIYISGRSMGSAAAIFAARELGERTAGYFLEQPYRDLDSAIRNRTRLLVPAYLGLRTWAPAFLPASIGEISPELRARDIPASIPVVLVSGSLDQRATISDVEAVQRSIPHARLIVFEGAAHVDLDAYDRALYRASFLSLLP